MSSTKLLILMVAVFGLLAAPSGAEEIETPQAAQATPEASDGPEEAAAVGMPTPDAAEALSPESPQGDESVGAEAPEAVEPEAPAMAEASADFEVPADSEAPEAPEVALAESAEAAAPADAAQVSEAEPVAEGMAQTEGEAEVAEVAGVPASQEGAEAMPASVAEVDPMADADADAPLPEVPRATLGSIGYDAEGRRGWIHVVRPADTLWDISDAYLGTPWVWPSIWEDNRNIPNPHLIEPGDRIWITPTHMRRLTKAEAEAFLANRPPEPAAAEEFEVALQEPELPPVEPEVAPEIPVVPEERSTQEVANRESAGLISPKRLESAASIVGSDAVRIMLSQEDEIFIGLGEGEVEVGDQFTIFRTHQKVFDPDTGALLGYHVETLGWLEVEAVYPETAQSRIRMSTGGVEVGDHVIPREPLPARIAVQDSPQGIEGKISFFPNDRALMGYNDFVYLNRGTDDGLQVGSPLEVYRVGYPVRDSSVGKNVQVPDRVVAQLLVVRADEEASVAVVTFAKTELAMGDRFRGAMQ
jgi:nucleoid-associated protein YgaU